jgi:hypothetical protein
MDAKVSWLGDLGSPTTPGVHDHCGIPLIVKGHDVARAKAEMSKSRCDVIFKVFLLNPKKGDEHFALGRVA